jgi:hypothetical protein
MPVLLRSSLRAEQRQLARSSKGPAADPLQRQEQGGGWDEGGTRAGGGLCQCPPAVHAVAPAAPPAGSQRPMPATQAEYSGLSGDRGIAKQRRQLARQGMHQSLLGSGRDCAIGAYYIH